MSTSAPFPLRRIAAVALSLAALVSTALAQPPVEALRPSIDPSSASWQMEFVAAANAARNAVGLSPQQLDADLAEAAQIHAEEMAALGYFSHASPTAARATPSARVALVGGPQIAVAENLALFGEPEDLVQRTIRGWLASPGHRANLLRPDHDEVGFGMAANARGETYIVQVTAAEPRDLVSAELATNVQTQFRIVATVHAARAVEAAVALGGDSATAVHLDAGPNELEFATTDARPQQLRIGVALEQGAGYVIDAAAWIEPTTGSLEPDSTAPRQIVRIAGVRTERVVERVTSVNLQYATGVRPLALFLDGAHVPGAEIAPGRLEVTVPAGTPSVVTIGIVDGDRATFFHRFTVEPAPDGSVRLVAGAPLEERD